MFGSKFLFTLVGLLVAVFAICKMSVGAEGQTVEGFFNGIQFGAKAMPYTKKYGAVSGNFRKPNFGKGYNPNHGHSRFVSTPKFDSILAPRNSGGVNYGAYIRYNTPDYKNQAVPCNPLTFGDMAKEDYTPGQNSGKNSGKNSGQNQRENYSNTDGGCGGSGCSAGCGKGGLSKFNQEVAGGYELPMGPGVLSSDPGSNYNKVWKDLRENSSEPETVNELPIGTMTVMDSAGNFEQPVVFDRLMYAPRPKSRLSGLGDMVRGDLAITPCQSGWFSVYPNINIDLQEGYLGVAGGAKAANQDLVNLMMQASGGAQTTIGGVDFSDPVNMTPETSQTIASLTDVYSNTSA